MPRTSALLLTLAVAVEARPARADGLTLLPSDAPLEAPAHLFSAGELSPFAAAVLSVFLPGLGQTFTGRFWTGFVILAGYVVIALVAKAMYDQSVLSHNAGLGYAAYGVMGVDLGLWGWNVYDAYANADAAPESPYAH
jgi:hypothetical protein